VIPSSSGSEVSHPGRTGRAATVRYYRPPDREPAGMAFANPISISTRPEFPKGRSVVVRTALGKEAAKGRRRNRTSTARA
jgi:hypothetical protein